MALNKAPESMIEISAYKPINVKDFGAIGDGVVDDTTAIQDAIDYCQTLSVNPVWDENDIPQTWGGTIELFFPDGVYKVTDSLVFNQDNRNLIVRNATIKADGAGWALTDFIFDTADGNSTYITFENCRLNCNHKCGGINARARHRIVGCHIERVGGTGIQANGSDVWIDRCIIGQWTSFDNEHYVQANYTGVGIKTIESDARITNCSIRWLYECIRIASTNILIANCHIFNGMQNFAANGGTGRTYHPLLVIEDGGANTYNTSLLGCYFDNGTIELYGDRVHFDNCKFACNSLHSNSADTYWIKNYASSVADTSRVRITNLQVFNADKVKKIIEWAPYLTNTWSANYSVIQASTVNDADVANEGVIFSPDINWILTGDSAYAVTYKAAGAYCRLGLSDNNTVTVPFVTSDGDSLLLTSDNFFTTATTFAFSNTAGLAEFGVRSNLGSNANLVLRESTASGGSTYTARGLFQWDATNSRTILRFTSLTGPFITSGTSSPEGVLSAPIGSLFLRSDGGTATTLYVKESGTGNTGWVSNATASYELIESVSADANAGPILDFYRNSASPAANDLIGRTLFRGKDSAGNSQDYAAIQAVINSPTSTAETGSLIFATTSSGTLTNQVQVTSGGNLEVLGAGKIGYGTGSGGTVTQATSKSTAVTIDKTNGSIVTHNETLGNNARALFTVNNNTVSATDIVFAHRASGGTANGYEVHVMQVASGSFGIQLTNVSGGSLSEAVTINFVVINAVIS